MIPRLFFDKFQVLLKENLRYYNPCLHIIEHYGSLLGEIGGDIQRGYKNEMRVINSKNHKWFWNELI